MSKERSPFPTPPVWQDVVIQRDTGSPTFKSSHRWLYDGWNVIAEFTAPSAASTTLTRVNTFTWGLDLSGTLQGAGGVGGLLVQTAVSGGLIERASYDGNGNIVSWTKSNASAPTSRREYDAFGNTLVSEGAAPCAFGFSTKMQDVETGLYYYGYRFYDPVTGRWPSRDPIGERGGVNLHGFVGNNGLNKFDYFGFIAGDFRPGEIPAGWPKIPDAHYDADELGITIVEPGFLGRKAKELNICGLPTGASRELAKTPLLLFAANLPLHIGHLSGEISGKFEKISVIGWEFNGTIDPEDNNRFDFGPNDNHSWWNGMNELLCVLWMTNRIIGHDVFIKGTIEYAGAGMCCPEPPTSGIPKKQPLSRYKNLWEDSPFTGPKF